MAHSGVDLNIISACLYRLDLCINLCGVILIQKSDYLTKKVISISQYSYMNEYYLYLILCTGCISPINIDIYCIIMKNSLDSMSCGSLHTSCYLVFQFQQLLTKASHKHKSAASPDLSAITAG